VTRAARLGHQRLRRRRHRHAAPSAQQPTRSRESRTGSAAKGHAEDE
jgi:hypothetical protein